MKLVKQASIAVAIAAASSSAFAANQPLEHSSLDLAIADEMKLIEMMQQSGKISKDATLHDAQQALYAYIQERQQQERKNTPQVDLALANKLAGGKSHTLNHALQNGKGNKLGQAKKNKPAPVMLESYDGETKTARILALLVEFPDFPHNSIQPDESAMYYEDYTADHYADILFGDEKWVAPNGHASYTMKMFYEEQSGGSYSVEGQVAGWYMASQPAAFYGNNTNGNARALVAEALVAAAADPAVNLSDFDIEDRYDLDGDGNYWEPDGLVDHVMIFHSSVGEEAGGGQLGEDAVWSHRSSLGYILTFPEVPAESDNWGGVMAAYDYTIQPADAAVGVMAHEYGHDLGLPDEYDTQYTGRGEPVSYWSLMSSGSWAGSLGGTMPTGFSVWAKEQLQGSLGGNWLHGATVHIDDIPANGFTALLDQAVSKGTNNDAVRIDLPMKQTVIATPTSGEYAYFSGSGNSLFNRMGVNLDLTSATSASANFKVWYDIEKDWDYGYVYVLSNAGVSFLSSDITTNDNPNGSNRGNGITGTSNGWVDASFDLSAFAGQQISLLFLYETDAYVANQGMFIDDVSIETNDGIIFEANADMEPEPLSLLGFETHNGSRYDEHYYLAEWRTHVGTDAGLGQLNVAGQQMQFDEGMVLWYFDSSYSDNWVGVHPGDGFLGVVDADQHTTVWSDRQPASTRYQVHDAAFGIDKSEKLHLDLPAYDLEMRDNFTKRNPQFDDAQMYIGQDLPDAGRNVPNYGLKIRVVSQSDDKSVGKILIHK